MKNLIIMFAIFVMAGPALAHHHGPPPAPPPDPAPASSSSSVNYAPGAAVAAASGLCVKDWKPGWQKCLSWSMIDHEDDEAVHAFGGGVTTRVDQFAVHFYGGVEDLEGDDTTIMIGGSLNFR